MPSFFVGGKMELVNIAMIFISGIIVSVVLNRMTRMGQSAIMMKKTILDCLVVMASSIQAQIEAYEMKYHALEIAERPDKYIEFQKKVDQQQLRTLQKTLIRNFIVSIPSEYSFLVKFHDWESAMAYLTTQLKGGTP